MEDSKLVIKPGASRLLTRISRSLPPEGIPAYLVGGFVRDALLGRDTADIDIAVPDALATAPGVAKALGGTAFVLDKDTGAARVVLLDKAWQIDFTSLQGDIEDDLARRDFTVNAMAIPLGDGAAIAAAAVIDPYGGRQDLERQLIRAVGEAVFRDDAARLLRAVRLAAELDFGIESGTEALMKRDAHYIAGVAGERVREELLRLLARPGAGARLACLDELGLLTALVPELGPARGVTQPKVHVWDVLEHSIQTGAAVEFVLRENAWEYAGDDILNEIPWSAEISAHFDREVSPGGTRRALLKLAALLHDVAKPQTRRIDADGRARFLGHPQQGAAAAAAIMERLRFSQREINLVELLVKYHLRPLQMSHEVLPTRRAIYRYFRDTGEAGIDLLYLCLADHLATRARGLDAAQWRAHTAMTAYVLAKYREEENIIAPPKLIDGHDIMQEFGLEPGPAVGELLEALREAQAAGEVTTREAGLAYLRRIRGRH